MLDSAGSQKGGVGVTVGRLSGIQSVPPAPPAPPEPPDPLVPPVPPSETHSGPSPRSAQIVPSGHVMSLIHTPFVHIKIPSGGTEQTLEVSTEHASPSATLPLHPTARSRGETRSAKTNPLYTWYFITTSIQRSPEVPALGDPHELFCNPRAMHKSKGFSGRSAYTGAFSAPCHHDALILRGILAPVLRDSGKCYAAGFALSANRTPE